MPTIEELQAQKDKNSQAWHSASQAEKDRLHQENVKLQQQIDSMTGGSSSFNSSTGKWTSSPGGYTPPGGGYNQPSTGGYTQGGGYTPQGTGGYSSPNVGNGYGSKYGTDANGQVDYSVLIRDAINSGASAEYVNGLLNQRMQKAQQSGMYQYVNDDVAKMANEYINNKRYEPNNLYKNMIEQMYSSASAQQEAAQRAAIEQAVNDLSGQKTGIVQSYDDLYKQLYLERRRAEKNLPQQLAAMGISGGMSESSALGIQNSYANALAQGEQEKLNTLNDIDQAIANARLTGEIGIAQQAAQLAMDKLSAYGSYVNGLMNQQQYYNNFLFNQQQADIANSQWQQEWDQKQIMYQLERDDIFFDRKFALAQYLYENTGRADGFKALGYSDEDIAAMKNGWYAQAMSSGGSGGSGSGSGSDTGPKMSLSTAKQLAEAGYFSDAALEVLRKAGYDDQALYYLYGYDPNSGNQTPYTGNGDNQNATIDMNSVIALGYGPIGADRLAELEASGKIERYYEDGKIKFRKKQNNILDALNRPGMIGG